MHYEYCFPHIVANQSPVMCCLKARGIHVYIEPSDDSESEHIQLVSHASHLQQLQPGPNDTHVYLDENDVLHWPVVFLYPEYRQSDFVQDFNEQQT